MNTITNTQFNSYLKTLTNIELKQLIKDTQMLCCPCLYNTFTECTANNCSAHKIIEQVNAELDIRYKE